MRAAILKILLVRQRFFAFQWYREVITGKQMYFRSFWWALPNESFRSFKINSLSLCQQGGTEFELIQTDPKFYNSAMPFRRQSCSPLRQSCHSDPLHIDYPQYSDGQGWANIVDPDCSFRSLIRVHSICHSVCIFWTHKCMVKLHPYSFSQFFWRSKYSDFYHTWGKLELSLRQQNTSRV